MLFNIKQCILVEEGLADLWQFTKSVNVSTLQSLPHTVVRSWCSKVKNIVMSALHMKWTFELDHVILKI